MNLNTIWELSWNTQISAASTKVSRSTNEQPPTLSLRWFSYVNCTPSSSPPSSPAWIFLITENEALCKRGRTMMMVEVGWLGSNTWHNYCVNNFLTIKKERKKDGEERWQFEANHDKDTKKRGTRRKLEHFSVDRFARSCQQKQSEFLSPI